MNDKPISGGITGPVLPLLLALLVPLLSVADPGDPPGRVARVNLVEGSGALQPADSALWLTDLLNRPLTAGDKLMIDGASRAELHVGSTAIRVAAQTSLEVLELDDRSERFGLAAGSLNLRVRSLSSDDTLEIDTPSVAVMVAAPGEYRIDVDVAAQIVTVGVIDGAAEVTGRSQDFRLEAEQQASIVGDLDLTVSFADLGAADGFDAWAALRDAHDDPLYAADLAPQEATGYEDLNDEHGKWHETVDFGPVWVPEVPLGWMPYQVGRWIWILPWGWTWQDAAPWGFTPFHYGRWIALGSTWGWLPGNPAVRPVYAPALVAWSDAKGSVAWVPLGAGEAYRPPYQASAAYSDALNAATTRARGGKNFSNWQVPGAVALLPAAGFTAGRPLDGHLAHLDTRNAKPLTRMGAPAAPSGAPGYSGAAGSARAPAANALFARPLVVARPLDHQRPSQEETRPPHGQGSGSRVTLPRDPSHSPTRSSRPVSEPVDRAAQSAPPAHQPLSKPPPPKPPETH